MLSAVRQGQLDTDRRLDRLEDRVDRGFAEVDRGFRLVEQRFDLVQAGLQQIVERLPERPAD